MSDKAPETETAPYVNVLARTSLDSEMRESDYAKIVEETLSLINRRFDSMRELDTVSKSNINPFLMLAMAPAYDISSPLEAAEYLQYAKMPHGDSTAFGKFVEDKIFPIFDVEKVEEKKTDGRLYSSIDALIKVEDQEYLATWKSGPWTMNQTHANEMIRAFREIHENTERHIVLGIFYGRPAQMNNKPSLVRAETGDYFHVLIGSHLWEFITGVKDAHMVVLDAVREAQKRFAEANGGKTFNEYMIEARLRLSEDFRKTFGLDTGDEDMWAMLFKHSF